MSKKVRAIPGPSTPVEILIMLVNKKEEYTEKIWKLSESIKVSDQVGDLEESAVSGAECDTSCAQIEQHRQVLALISDAEIRVGMGTYGTCPDCDIPIEAARLAAWPWAERCRSCQEASEEGATPVWNNPRLYQSRRN